MASLANPPVEVGGSVTPELVKRFRTALSNDERFKQSMNAVCVTPISKVALNRERVTAIDHSFSHHLPENKSVAQMQSGRCWMFAALNTFRVEAIKNLNVDTDFELSQNYLTFWDKFEKANYFLESILNTLEEPIGSRLLDWLLSGPVNDGGQWHMFINLVRKYGVMPKRAMPETESSSNTRELGYHLTHILRDYACRLRTAHASGKGNAELRKMKDGYLAEAYRMLAIHLGEPPTEFDWQWRDKEKTFHRDGTMTPQAFYAKYVAINLDDMVCLIHDPRPHHKFDTVYTVNYLGNVVGGEIIKYLNVPVDTLKKAAIAQIKDGSSVWFGNDVGKFLDRDLGVMDLDLFRFDLVYGAEPTMNKAERLQYGSSQMTHAMVFTGVDLDENDRPLKWRVENSWGDKPGDKGFLQMTDAWFDEFMYEVVVHRKYVPAKALAGLEKEPVGLDPWDPMGSLAWIR
jgi:bleomycin hydrolase